jgi:hypothetical protein
MKELGEIVLNELCEQKGVDPKARKFRFGFHLPPCNSINHIHLHGLVEPLSHFIRDKVTFGLMLTTSEEMN